MAYLLNKTNFLDEKCFKSKIHILVIFSVYHFTDLYSLTAQYLIELSVPCFDRLRNQLEFITFILYGS